MRSASTTAAQVPLQFLWSERVAQVIVKLFGDDTAVLKQKASEMAAVLQGVDGIPVGQVCQDNRVFDIAIRFPEAKRQSAEAPGSLLINLPFAMVGGVFALMAWGLYLSVPASVGFIVLFVLPIIYSFVEERRARRA